MDDVEAVVEIVNTCTLAAEGRKPASVSDMKNSWTEPSFDLRSSSLAICNADGEMVAAAELRDWGTPFIQYRTAGAVLPGYCGLGLGTFINTWAEQLARERVDRAPKGARVSLFVRVSDKDHSTIELLDGLGYARARHFWRMIIELEGALPEPVFPPGIGVANFADGPQDDAAFRAILAADIAAFRDHWGYVEAPFEEEYATWLHETKGDPDFDPRFWYLAMDGEEIAGFSLCWTSMPEDPEMGFVGSLGVLRQWRRQGIALALLRHSFRDIKRLGRKRVGLGVDAESLTGATKLYEKAGMHVAHQSMVVEKELRAGTNLMRQSVE